MRINVWCAAVEYGTYWLADLSFQTTVLTAKLLN